jgi:hypothetical protein
MSKANVTSGQDNQTRPTLKASNKSTFDVSPAVSERLK